MCDFHNIAKLLNVEKEDGPLNMIAPQSTNPDLPKLKIEKQGYQVEMPKG